MALKITDRMVDGVAVEALEGRIVLGEESNALREKVKSLLASGKKKIVLNMDNVTYIDSSGLGTLVASHTSARAGCVHEDLQPGLEVPGNPAGNQVGYRIRGLPFRSRRDCQLRKVTAHFIFLAVPLFVAGGATSCVGGSIGRRRLTPPAGTW